MPAFRVHSAQRYEDNLVTVIKSINGVLSSQRDEPQTLRSRDEPGFAGLSKDSKD